MTLENYSEPDGVGLCANCGKEWDDHWLSNDIRNPLARYCDDGSEFEERDADWYAEREASRRER